MLNLSGEGAQSHAEYSGKEDLYRRTSDLLTYNRKRLAQLEVEREKKLLS